MGDAVAELPGALSALGAELRTRGWDLALEVVEEGLTDDVIPSMVRLGRLAQLGDMPTFISELGREVETPMPGRMRVGGPLAAIARDHARQREALGFAPREVVTEFLLLRRVLWRLVAGRVEAVASGDLLEIERRLNDTIDRLVVECVVAYFDRATSELRAQERWTDAAPLTARWTAHFPLDAEACARQIETLCALDRVAEARAVHGAFVMRLRAELGESPDDAWSTASDTLIRDAASRESAATPAPRISDPIAPVSTALPTPRTPRSPALPAKA